MKRTLYLTATALALMAAPVAAQVSVGVDAGVADADVSIGGDSAANASANVGGDKGASVDATVGGRDSVADADVSVGGDRGANANATVGGGSVADVNANVGGSGGVDAGVTVGGRASQPPEARPSAMPAPGTRVTFPCGGGTCGGIVASGSGGSDGCIPVVRPNGTGLVCLDPSNVFLR